MDDDRREPADKSFLHLLVGIEAGIIGGVAMLACFSLITPLLGKPWWLIPNLLASRLYADRQALFGPGIVTVVGAAYLLLSAGMIGAINGLLTPGGRLFGLAVAATAYLTCYLFVWKKVAPLMLVYAPQPVIIVAFFVYGSAIGWHPHLLEFARSGRDH
jgi:hypothetical protein